MKKQVRAQVQRHRQLTLFSLGIVSGLLSGLAALTLPGGWIYAPGFLFGPLVVWPWSWEQDARSLPLLTSKVRDDAMPVPWPPAPADLHDPG